MTEVYKILHGVTKVNASSWFEMASVNARTTRQVSNPWNIRPKHGRLEIRRNFFSMRVINPWNQIPEDIRAAKTVTSFRNRHAQYREETVPHV